MFAFYRFNINIYLICDLDGNWTDWSQWSPCSLTCGGGNQTQRRSCNNPAPANGGNNCSATDTETETQTCNSQPCPIGK